jgi:hypothetical protein
MLHPAAALASVKVAALTVALLHRVHPLTPAHLLIGAAVGCAWLCWVTKR